MWKRDFFTARLILKNSKDSYLCFRLPLLHSVSYFFLFFWSPSSSPYSSNISDVLSVNPSANAFIFGDFNDGHQKDWLSCSDGTDRPGELWSWKTSDGWLFFLNPWLCFNLGFLYFFFFFWPYYLVYSSLPSIRKFWSCCLTFHWLSFILQKGYTFLWFDL